MNRLSSFLAAMVFFATPALADEPAEWVSMFNGKTLEGWTQKNGYAIFKVGDGFIGGVTQRGSPISYLCTVEEYEDFELELEVRISGEVVSGVQIRSQTSDENRQSIYNTGRVHGPQVRIARGGATGGDAGYLYYESRDARWMTPESRRVPHKHFRDREWNRIRVIANGPRIQTFVNGQKIDDLTDEASFDTHRKGFVGLQVLPVDDDSRPLMMWRNLRIRSLR